MAGTRRRNQPNRGTRSRKKAEPKRSRAARSRSGESEGGGGSRFTFEGILLGALLVYAAHQFHYLLFDASYFKLQKIQVSGNQRLTEKQVLGYSGLELGMPAFQVEPELVAERILRNPKVRVCEVERPSPNELRIQVGEKPEVARIVLQGTLYEVSGEGEVMIEAGFDSDKPLLLDAEVEEGPPRRLAPRFRERMKIWFPILAAGPTSNFTRVRFGGGGRLDVYWQDVRLVVDDPERFKLHRPFLGPVLADARERGLEVEYVDLRFQDVVAKYRPLGTAAAAEAARSGAWAESSTSLPTPSVTPRASGDSQGAAPGGDLDSFLEQASSLYQTPLQPPAGP